MTAETMITVAEVNEFLKTLNHEEFLKLMATQEDMIFLIGFRDGSFGIGGSSNGERIMSEHQNLPEVLRVYEKLSTKMTENAAELAIASF